jgi:hypothetical protein
MRTDVQTDRQTYMTKLAILRTRLKKVHDDAVFTISFTLIFVLSVPHIA